MATGQDANGNTNAYNDPNPVPIGAIITVTATLPGGNNAQVNWKGGTTYSSYPLGAADSNAPASMNPVQNVINTGPNYNFIADAKPRTYTITATAGAGQSTITFTTYGPTGALTQQPTGGAANFNASGTDPGGNTASAFVSYNNPANPTLPLSAGMYIKAQVTASPKVGGTLMFFQTITTQRTASGTNGMGVAQTVNWSGNGQVAADNGGTQAKGGGTGLIGYPTTASNFNPTPPAPPTYITSWPCPVGGPVADQYMTDTPYVTVPVANLPTLLQVGTTNQQGNPVPESFSTYLMFQGESAVWVPIAQLNWSWSITATNGAGGWTVTNQTSPMAASPAGGPPTFGPFFTTTYAGSKFQ